jgi:hypothetical protein
LLHGRQVRLAEELSESVFRANGWRRAVEAFERPGDVESGVVPEDGTFAGGVVEVSCFVKDFSGVGENKEAVSEAFRDPEHLEIIIC